MKSDTSNYRDFSNCPVNSVKRLKRSRRNNNLGLLPLICTWCFVGSASLHAEEETMTDLGTLTGEVILFGGNQSLAYGVNADGSVVVGSSGDWREPIAFRWTEATGMVSLGTLAGGSTSIAFGVNADGNVVVGWSASTDGRRAFRWTEATGMVNLGTLSGFSSVSSAYGINADGSVVVGVSQDGKTSTSRAFRWTADTGMVNLGTFTGGSSSTAWGVNADGNVVVGGSGSTDGDRAFRWTADTGMVDLGTLKDGNFSIAYGVNADGNVVVGTSSTTDFKDAAFRWTEATGMVSLGTLAGGFMAEARDVNADGSVVVGWSDTETALTPYASSRAFRWTADTGMVDLGTLTGGSTARAESVNADGNVVVGWSDSTDGRRAFIWRKTISEGDTPGTGSGGTMEDFANLIGSFPRLAEDNAVAVAQHQSLLRQTMQQTGFAGEGRTRISARTQTSQTPRNPTRIDRRAQNIASFSIGRGLTDQFTLGATGTLNTSLRNNGFDTARGYSLGLWGLYSAGGATLDGLQLGLALGYGEAKTKVSRGRNLRDVVVAKGSTRLRTQSIQASFGYGLHIPAGWLMTPRFTIAHYDTRRAGYAEAGASFNASYAAARASRTDATFEMTAERALGERGRLSFGLGVEQTLNTRMPRLAGTSDIPGLQSFDMRSDFGPNRTRPFMTAGYRHDTGNGASLSGDIRIGRAEHGKSLTVGVSTSYAWRF